MYTYYMPVSIDTEIPLLDRRGPGLREDRHTTLVCKRPRKQEGETDGGRRGMDVARSCAREATTENTDTFRESYFSHPASSPATYF